MAILDQEYADDGGLREQDRVPLEVFLADKDRTQITGRGQAFFSGREREISAFRAMANGLSLGRQGNATLVVEGPPGVGKSAILDQFQEEMRSFPNTESNRQWLPVALDGAEAARPRAIMAAVDEALAKRLAEDLLATKGKAGEEAANRLRGLLGIGKESLGNLLSIAKGIIDRGVSAMSFSIGPKSGTETGTLRDVAHHRGKDWANWQIMLLIDEGQRISDQMPDADRSALSSIHQGILPIPISMCVFGLPGTWTALGQVGISRSSMDTDLSLVSLDDRASRMAVRRCFARFNVTHGDAWEQAIVERSANWPQHLAAYLTAAMAALSRSHLDGSASWDAHSASLADALRQGDLGRKGYYRRRVERLTEENPLFEEYAQQLVPLLRAGAGGLRKAQIVRRLMAEEGISAQEASAFVRAAEHSGFLASDLDGVFTMPIPSFAGHLLNEAFPPVPNTPRP